jgi:hypothetical protein
MIYIYKRFCWEKETIRMKKTVRLLVVASGVVLALVLSFFAFAHSSAQATGLKAKIKTYNITVHTANNPDSGTCGNNWAIDAFNRTFTVVSNHPNTIQELFDDASFVTTAGQSPASCQPGRKPVTVSKGIHGTFTGEETITVTGGTFNPKAVCSKKTPCNSTTAFVTLFYGPSATWTSPSFQFNYTTHENGRWQNASLDEGGNHGDISGHTDHDRDD